MRTTKALPLILLTLLVLGGFFRLTVYLFSDSFWKDEVGLARNFLTHDLSNIQEAFHDGQAAPIGFVQISKLAEMTLGHTEKAFWLFPFLAGIAMLFMAARQWRGQLPTVAWVTAVGLLVFNGTLIKYGVQFKPYLTDAFVTLLLTGTFWMQGRGVPYRWSYYFAVGLAALWLSYTSVFVIAGLGLWQIGEALYRKQYREALWATLTNALLAAVFGYLWFTNFSQIDPEGFFKKFWEGSFAPLGLNWWDLNWFGQRANSLMDYLLGGFSGVMGLFLFALGVARARGINVRMMGLLLPIIITIAASFAKIYPLNDRLELFWAPLVLPFVALGVDSLWEHYQRTHRQMWVVFALFLAVPYCVPTIIGSFSHNDFQDLKRASLTIATQANAGDIVWVHPRAHEMYKYYFKRFPLREGVMLVYANPKTDLINSYAGLKENFHGHTVFIAATEPSLGFSELDLLQSQADEEKNLKGNLILSNALVVKLKL